MQTLKVIVNRRWAVAHEVEAFELMPIDELGTLPPYEAGAHIDVHLPNNLVRQYSLCGKPDAHNRYVIAVLKAVDSRGGSRYMHDQIVEGQIIEISKPRNAFKLLGESQHKVLIAGGIGITPLLAMTYELERRLNSFELHYFLRSPNLIAFQN
jgi:vanillate O-demethylase ferredoxin subunit